MLESLAWKAVRVVKCCILSLFFHPLREFLLTVEFDFIQLLNQDPKVGMSKRTSIVLFFVKWKRIKDVFRMLILISLFQDSPLLTAMIAADPHVDPVSM